MCSEPLLHFFPVVFLCGVVASICLVGALLMMGRRFSLRVCLSYFGAIGDALATIPFRVLVRLFKECRVFVIARMFQILDINLCHNGRCISLLSSTVVARYELRHELPSIQRDFLYSFSTADATSLSLVPGSL